MHKCMTFQIVIAALCHSVINTSTALANAPIDKQFARLLSDEKTDYDFFGESVAISGNVAVVGARWDDTNGTRAGAAYVFDTTTGRRIAKLHPDDGAPFDFFGISVAIYNDTIAVGAPFADTAFANTGAVYLFDASTGQQFAKLQPNDNEAEKHFGRSVAIHDNFILIGATGDNDNGDSSGSAYLFDFANATQLHKLLPTDGTQDDIFGVAVTITGTTAVVTATGDTDNGFYSGSAYLFDTKTGNQLSKLVPDDGANLDFFGTSVAANSNAIVISSPGNNDNGPDSGSVYQFNMNGQLTRKILPNDGAQDDFFGTSVAINDSLIVVGSHYDDDNGENSGSAYIFDTTTGQQTAKLMSTDGRRADQFGKSVAIAGNTVLVGAPNDQNISTDFASAYLFTNACLADINRDGNLNFLDVSAYLNAFANHDPVADFILDRNYNFIDVSQFLTAFTSGCP